MLVLSAPLNSLSRLVVNPFWINKKHLVLTTFKPGSWLAGSSPTCTRYFLFVPISLVPYHLTDLFYLLVLHTCRWLMKMWKVWENGLPPLTIKHKKSTSEVLIFTISKWIVESRLKIIWKLPLLSLKKYLFSCIIQACMFSHNN